ncbi:MAG: SDR family oxidoreductase [Desulforhopalus sp.]
MTDFSGKIALISGATRGIGKAIAENFLRAGARVIGLYAANRSAAEAFLAENSNSGTNLEVLRCDITNEAEVHGLFAMLDEKYETLDILVNNAGIRDDAFLAMMRSEQWQQVLDTNLTGTFLMSKQAILMMMKNKFGRIINITSPVADLGFPGQANYAASKAGQVALTKTLAKEVAKKKITVNCVAPGFISTDFIGDLSKEQLAAYKKLVPMRRFGTPQEIADAVLFLAGNKASYITGTVLTVSGGL